MEKDRVEIIGYIYAGHDSELYIETEDGADHDVYLELQQLEISGDYRDKNKVRLIIEKI